KIYRAICTLLKNDPILKRVGLKWQVWDGVDLVDATDLELPAISLLPGGGETALRSEIRRYVNMHLEIVIPVDGTVFAGLANLWEAVRAAVYPGDDSVIKALNEFDVTEVLPIKAGYAEGKVGDNDALMGVGEIVVSYMTGTRS